ISNFLIILFKYLHNSSSLNNIGNINESIVNDECCGDCFNISNNTDIISILPLNEIFKCFKLIKLTIIFKN
ncbi:unnamed protein product, partial [Rotaria sp. Silwood1]